MKKSPLVVILSCKKNKEKQNFYRSYFSGYLDYLIVCGDNKKTSLDGDTLKLKEDDSYELLHLKMIETYKYLYKHIKRPILKIDDDSFLNRYGFKTYNFDFDYGGFINPGRTTDYTYHYDKVTDKRFCTPITDTEDYNFALGGGYFLSTKALKLFLGNYRNVSEVNNHLHLKKGREDRIVGKTLYNFYDNLKINNDGYWIDQKKLFYSIFNNTILHPLNAEKMSFLATKKHSNFYVKCNSNAC
jgi:hypothetical protein